MKNKPITNIFLKIQNRSERGHQSTIYEASPHFRCKITKNPLLKWGNDLNTIKECKCQIPTPKDDPGAGV